MIQGHVYPFTSVDVRRAPLPQGCGAGSGVGPSTYLHAVPGKGWPYDPKAEDAFEVPPMPVVRDITGAAAEAAFLKQELATPETNIEYVCDGNLLLQITTVSTRTQTLVATFGKVADARTAAEALNNHKGY